jgi:hypothetical protein
MGKDLEERLVAEEAYDPEANGNAYLAMSASETTARGDDRRPWMGLAFLLFVASVALSAALAVEVNKNNSSSPSPAPAASASGSSTKLASQNQEQLFQKFVKDYSKKYSHPQERAQRKAIFTQNMKAADRNNEAEGVSGSSAIYGVTKFSDWTYDELASLRGYNSTTATADSGMFGYGFGYGYEGYTASPTPPVTSSGTVTCDQNWITASDKTGKTDILPLNQGRCGSCWIFSTVETLRMGHITQHGTDPGRLSTQYVVDCFPYSTSEFASGSPCRNSQGAINGVGPCCGGFPINLMQWLKTSGGLPTAAAYGDLTTSTRFDGDTDSGHSPTVQKTCKQNIPKAVTVESANVITSMTGTTEADLLKHICNTDGGGSVAIAISAEHLSQYTGSNPVLTYNSCNGQPDHAVELVGVSKSRNAWIVRNSWGRDWGVTMDGTPASEACAGINEPWINCNAGFFFMAVGQNTCNVEASPAAWSNVGTA